MRFRDCLDSLLRAALPVLLVLLTTPASAQVSTLARVSGSVVDPEGKPIRAATITLENTDSGQTMTTTTDERGRFVVLGLRPTVWNFVIAAPGFATLSGSGRLSVGIDANPPLNVVLQRSGGAVGSLVGLQARDIQADLATGDTLFGLQRWDEAIAVYKTILSKATPLTSINLQIGLAYRRKGDTAAAIAAYEELLKSDPVNEKATIGIALAHAEKGDRKTALDLLSQSADKEGAGREVFFSLGELNLENGNTDEAMKWYRRASDVDGSWGKPLYKLGVSAAQRGETAAARSFLTRTIDVDPLSPEAALAKTAIEKLGR
jgi:Flp pilus assembly protein TadD